MKRVLVLLSVTALVGAIAMACGGGDSASSSSSSTTSSTTSTSSGGDTSSTSTTPATDADAGAPASSTGAM